MTRFTLPIELVTMDHHSYHIFMTCFINGHECEMLIDTGASRSVFDITHLSETLPAMPPEEIVTAAVSPGNISTSNGILDSFSLGDISWKQVPVLFMDLSHINEVYSRFTSKKIAGLLGSDLLFQTKARIDYGKKSIRFSIPVRYIPQL